jgi:hypothetical protein
MKVWVVPVDIREAIPALPARIYLNQVIEAPLEATLRELIVKGLHREIRTYDGCFVVRKQRGSNAISTHSFGLAIDLNAAWNPLVRGVTPATRKRLRAEKVTFSEDFLDVWRKHGWNCGADWITLLDGMHFQWDKF